MNIINNPKNSPTLKRDGEGWVIKSADCGYELAINLATKYGLKLKPESEGLDRIVLEKFKDNFKRPRPFLSFKIDELEYLFHEILSKKVEFDNLLDEISRRKNSNRLVKLKAEVEEKLKKMEL